MQVKLLKIRNLSWVSDDVLWQESFGSVFVYLFLLEERSIYLFECAEEHLKGAKGGSRIIRML